MFTLLLIFWSDLHQGGVLSGTVFPMFSCITLLWEFAALKALSKSHCISGMLQHCVMNISIFGSGADVVVTMYPMNSHILGVLVVHYL